MSDVVNKKALAEAVVERFDLTKKAAQEIVDLVFDQMTVALKSGTTVEIAGFGKFIVKVRESRMATNPRTKEKIQLEATKVPAFKASKTLKEIVK